MSVDVFVARGQGDKLGQDVVDVLVSETSVALKRGQNELDEQGGYFSSVTMEAPLSQAEGIGDLIQLQDFTLGISWRAKVRGVSHTISIDNDGKVSASTSFSLQRKLG